MLPKPKRRGPKRRRPIARRVRPRNVRARTSNRIGSFAPQGKLRELADDLQSLYVRHFNGWACWCCGSSKANEMQAAHLFAKSEYHAGRYLIDNLRCLCMRCHKYWTHRPSGWHEYLEARLGASTFDRLQASCQVRQGPHDYVLVAIAYRIKLHAMPNLCKVQERYDALVARGRKLGIFS